MKIVRRMRLLRCGRKTARWAADWSNGQAGDWPRGLAALSASGGLGVAAELETV